MFEILFPSAVFVVVGLLYLLYYLMEFKSFLPTGIQAIYQHSDRNVISNIYIYYIYSHGSKVFLHKDISLYISYKTTYIQKTIPEIISYLIFFLISPSNAAVIIIDLSIYVYFFF